LAVSLALRNIIAHDQQAARRAVRRRHQHRTGAGSAFCKRYNLTLLILAEEHETILDAIAREKALKAWQRDWKIRLIEESNPDWDDLAGTVFQGL